MCIDHVGTDKEFIPYFLVTENGSRSPLIGAFPILEGKKPMNLGPKTHRILECALIILQMKGVNFHIYEPNPLTRKVNHVF